MLSTVGNLIRRVWFWALIAALAMVLVNILSARPVNDGAIDATHRVVYRLTGKSDATLTFQERPFKYPSRHIALVSSHTLEEEPLPWSKTVFVRGDYTSVQLLAYSTSGLPKATVTCTITVDGKLAWKETSASKGSETKCFALGLSGR